MANSAKKKPNGKWDIQYRYTDWKGESKKTTKRGFNTKKEAEEWLAHFLVLQASSPSIHFKDFWEIYKEDMSKRLKESTMENKEHLVRTKLLPYFGELPLNEITAVTVRKWQGEMMEKGYKPTYLKTINNQLSAIMNYAVTFYDLKTNPCKRAGTMGKSHAEERPFWTLEEFNSFLDAVSDKYEAWMGFQIMFWTGMRVGECLALKIEDIDFDNGTIRVDESYSRIKRKDVIASPKTDSSIRFVTIHDELLQTLHEYVASIYRARPSSRLFPEKTKRFFEHEMDRGIEKCGVKRITVHCLRHSHASLLLKLGYNPLEIAKRLGHKRVTTTIETYCHPSMDAQYKIAESLGKVNKGETDAV